MDYQFEKFITLTQRPLGFSEAMEELVEYAKEDTGSEYRIIVGTDSEGYGKVAYASAIVVHRVGSGGRAFICKNIIDTPRSLREKIYREALLSLYLSQKVLPVLREAGLMEENFMIHVDVGTKGETKDIIKEVTGMVKGYGFQVAIKPESYAASSVADRFAVPPKTA